MPQSTKTERIDAEKNAFTSEFEHLRVAIAGQKELYIFDEAARSKALINMQMESCKYMRTRIKRSADQAEAARKQTGGQKLAQQRIALEKANLEVQLTSTHDQLQSSRDHVNELKDENAELKDENKKLKESLGKLLPRKMQGVLKGLFCGGE